MASGVGSCAGAVTWRAIIWHSHFQFRVDFASNHIALSGRMIYHAGTHVFTMASNQERTGGMLNRRTFLKSASLALGSCGLAKYGLVEGWAGGGSGREGSRPDGGRPAAGQRSQAGAVPALSRIACTRSCGATGNWCPPAGWAEVVGASAGDIVRLGRSMGLAGPPRITVEQQRRAALVHHQAQLAAVALRATPATPGLDGRRDGFLAARGRLSLRQAGQPEAAMRAACGTVRPMLARRHAPGEIAGILRAEFPEGVGRAGAAVV